MADEASNPVDVTPWHELQDWIWRQDNRVTIPFARYLAENVPPVAVRLRRDFGAILSLIKAHAVLHQATRARDEQGRLIATEADYEAVRALLLDVVSEGIGATVSPTLRETVTAIADVPVEEVSAAEIGRLLRLDKSAARRRLQAAIAAGYVVNLEERRGRPGRYSLGDALPDDLEILPPLPPRHQAPDETAGQAGGGTVASVSETVDEASPQVTEEEAIAKLKASGLLPATGREYISDLRSDGHGNDAIAIMLQTGGYPPPPGAVRWSGYMVAASMGETGGQA